MSSSDSSSDDDLLDLDDEEIHAITSVLLTVVVTVELFQSGEVDHLDQKYVDTTLGVTDQLAPMMRLPSLFKNMTNFTVEMFEELIDLVCPVIANNARSTGDLHTERGRPSKLTPQQRLLSFLLYMKHDNSTVFDGHHWNWSKTSTNDDGVFVGSCINAAIGNEIRWPTVAERPIAGTRIDEFPGCIGYIDGTLVKIRRPFQDPGHSRWFNGRKKMYSVNNTVIVDHDGLFIFVDPGFPGSFHDITILRHSEIHANWRDYFEHQDDYLQFVLGDPGYLGEDMYILRRISHREVQPGSERVIDAFNSRHAGIRVRVEWGIGGLKRKWKRLMKRFDSTKPKFCVLFKSACLLTNFIHRRRLNMHIILEAADDDEGGCNGDY